MNVIWIVADELRADALGCYEGPRADTPNIDRLAANGVRFTNAFTPALEAIPAIRTTRRIVRAQ